MKTNKIFNFITFFIGVIFVIEINAQTNIGINFPINIPISNMDNTATPGLLYGSLNFGYMFAPNHEGRIDLSYHKFGEKTYYNSKISGSFIPITFGYNYYFVNNDFKFYATINTGNYIGSGDFKKSHLGFAPGFGLSYAFPNSNIKLNFSPLYNIVSSAGDNIHYLSLNIGLAYKLSSGESSGIETKDETSGTKKTTKNEKKKDNVKKSKELKFESTGTSADGFLKASFDLGKRVKEFNTKLEDITIFISVLLSNPADLIGKDASAAIITTRQTGSSAISNVNFEELTTKANLFKDLKTSDIKSYDDAKAKYKDAKDLKDSVLKEIMAKVDIFKDLKTSDFLPTITGFIDDLKGVQNDLKQIPDDVTKLINEAKDLPGNLKSELTGLKATKLPKVLKGIDQSKGNLEATTQEVPKMVDNVIKLISLLDVISSSFK